MAQLCMPTASCSVYSLHGRKDPVNERVLIEKDPVNERVLNQTCRSTSLGLGRRVSEELVFNTRSG